jgi:uncharacterized protein YkwD
MPFAFDCQSDSGLHHVEIMGENADGPQVLANFPILCGSEPARTIAWVRSASVAAMTPDALEAHLLDAVARARKQHGAKPLVHDERLDRVAKRYCEEMIESEAFAHVSQQSGTVVDRLEKAGLTFSAAGENLALGTDPTTLHEGLMASASHRQNILDNRFSHIGVGAVRYRDGYLVTQVFARDLKSDARPAAARERTPSPQRP